MGLRGHNSAHHSRGGWEDARGPAPPAGTPSPGKCAPCSRCGRGSLPSEPHSWKEAVMCHPLWLAQLSHHALCLQAPLGHAELHSQAQADVSPRPPAEPALLVPALRVPGMSTAH